MLNRRTQILFSDEQWRNLSMLSSAEKRSIGELVRHAVDEYYKQQAEMAASRAAIEHIMKIRPQPSKIKIDYKALINEGRKY